MCNTCDRDQELAAQLRDLHRRRDEILIKLNQRGYVVAVKLITNQCANMVPSEITGITKVETIHL